MNDDSVSDQRSLYDPAWEHDACGVGFVCDIKGKRSGTIVRQGLEVLRRLAHRGATGADPLTGDGAGILIQTPHEFFLDACDRASIRLPDRKHYGTGVIFLPSSADERRTCKEIIAAAAIEQGQTVLGWRELPVDDSRIGKTARATQPVFEQVFIGRNPAVAEDEEFERILYLVRKEIEHAVRTLKTPGRSAFHITHLSSRTFIYKGLLLPRQLPEFFRDLEHPLLSSAIALVHSRYSTNTFPTWDLAQPFRFLAHNGEINTLRGNVNWTRAKENLLKSDLFGDGIARVKPVIVPGGSDSAALDNIFELLVLSGRSPAHAMMMLIPAAWEHDHAMEPALRDFYRYHACLMEPWDGPAAVAFTDGRQVGATLDRNGLRPARYVATKNDLVVMASEVGVLDIPPEEIERSGRLEPGRLLLINTEEGRIVSDEEIQRTVSRHKPYGRWLQRNLLPLADLPVATGPARREKTETRFLFRAFGYTREDFSRILAPMAETGAEPIGSMGNDTPHAVLSRHAKLLYDYFKQLFAQVTNPAIDPIREKLVMSLESFMGIRRNLLDETSRHCRKLHFERPVLSDGELLRIRRLRRHGFKSKTISLLFPAKDTAALMTALDRICTEACIATQKGCTILILSDRGVNKNLAAVPALLAVGAVHQYLVHRAIRAQVGIILETAEPREVHHFAVLFGYGAGAVNPYLAFEGVRTLVRDGTLAFDEKTALDNYLEAVNKGLLKVLSRMGISTLQSYRGAQIFEAIGLGPAVMQRCFSGTTSRIGGADFDVIAKETLMRHQAAFPEREGGPGMLPSGGIYQWKKDGECHMWNPETIARLQDAARTGDRDLFREFSDLVNKPAAPCTLRHLLAFKKTTPVPLDEVEPVTSLVTRFVTGAMSFGSLSREAHETIATAMNRLGGRSNSGEGGEDPVRFVRLENGDSLRSAVKQVASGRFGVTTHYLVNADELQIKIAQGAKPGEGGQLPGHKVSAVIAHTRHTTPGVTLISPPPHHDIYSIEDLAQLIFDLKNVNPRARISVKLVSEIGVGTVAAGVAKGHADMILISGGDGGTGAAPLSSIRHAGLPWELGLSETHQTLLLNRLRSRVRLQTDGQLRTGRDVAIAACLGAEEFGFAGAALVVLGCVMLRHCHLNRCSLGVATQDELLRRRFAGRPEHLVNYFTFVAEELREIMASLGIRRMEELTGRSDLLETNPAAIPWKAHTVDFSRILYKPPSDPDETPYRSVPQNHAIEAVMDHELIRIAEPALSRKEPILIRRDIATSDRATGAMLSGEICRLHGGNGLPNDTITCLFTGAAGQSFGAFLVRGVTFVLEGMANDYVGKGLFGGTIVIRPSPRTVFAPENNIIIGNTAFYGATDGEAYIGGGAGERFCIRNSGLYAVVENVGDHACEYMTGGRVLIIGKTGRNFAAGMSGGIAYVYDPDGTFPSRCNTEMAVVESLNREDERIVMTLLTDHVNHTNSARGRMILENFRREKTRMVRVIPHEYKTIIENGRTAETAEFPEESDG